MTGTSSSGAGSMVDDSNTVSCIKPAYARRYRCTESDKYFTRKCYLKIRKRNQTGDKPESCPGCGKLFSGVSQMVQHLQVLTGDKPYKCTECGKSFNRAYHLKRHQQVHSSHCNMTPSRAHSLKIHQQTHSTGCDMALSCEHVLKTHHVPEPG